MPSERHADAVDRRTWFGWVALAYRQVRGFVNFVLVHLICIPPGLFVLYLMARDWWRAHRPPEYRGEDA